MATTDNPLVLDPFRAAGAERWKVIDASMQDGDLTFEADVAIVGTGAGGGTAAEILVEAGLTVLLIEEGPLRSSSEFRMREAEVYPDLYQESAARKTKDKAINILQGRCVGGGTTVNWTSSFRTPDTTLRRWAADYGLTGFGAADLAPWFERMEARLSIAPWVVPPNANNDALARGAAALGIATASIRRNVKNCWDLGYCGMGCPVNAKQSMLVTTIPGALARGATLVTRARAVALEMQGDRVTALRCVAMDARGNDPTSRQLTVRARAFVSAAGAIGTPALLLRSRVPDPAGVVGKRTFLHPTVVSAALMPETVAAWAGAPQSIYSDHFLDTLPPDGPMGYKLEAPPLHPVLAAITLPNHGAAHAGWMREMPRLQVLIALLRDGFVPDSPGGTVVLRDDGTPVLDYPFSPYVWDGARRAFLSMAEIQFAAGARRVMPIHGEGAAYATWGAAKAAIDGFTLAPLTTTVVSAHVMGGSPLGPDPKRAAVDAAGRYHHLANLYVMDGSLFPTSIGANPQLSIYGIVARLADGLARTLAPRA
ncbi:MAG: GMC family oxidoreductase [Betaproteobacteria bacterium]